LYSITTKPNRLTNLVIYQAKNGAIELKADSNVEAIWASQKQIAQVFVSLLIFCILQVCRKIK
jgi:hypothetical protein